MEPLGTISEIAAVEQEVEPQVPVSETVATEQEIELPVLVRTLGLLMKRLELPVEPSTPISETLYLGIDIFIQEDIELSTTEPTALVLKESVDPIVEESLS